MIPYNSQSTSLWWPHDRDDSDVPSCYRSQAIEMITKHPLPYRQIGKMQARWERRMLLHMAGEVSVIWAEGENADHGGLPRRRILS
ncbi:MAG: hypothetical protein ACMUIA_05980 [bacterium]